MTNKLLKKQVDNYLPLLSNKQQALVLEMIKSFLNVDTTTLRITKKQYNKDLKDAIKEIENNNYVTNKEALKALSKW